MNKTRIIIDEAIPFIKGVFDPVADTVYLPGDEFTRDSIKKADALIVRTRTHCNSDLLTGTDVKLISSATIGTDHIDKDWCRDNGVAVTSSPGCNAPGVAQYVIASLLKTGFRPSVKTLGVVGFGNVGSIVADWADRLGFRVLISDAPKKEAGCKDADFKELEEVLEKSDAVTLHVPLTKSGEHPTLNLIGLKELRLMKPGSVVINTSRGGVVDEEILKEFLLEGRLKAIVDVWKNEPSIDTDLLKMVEIATPHIAGYSLEGKIRATGMVADSVEKFFNIKGDRSRIPVLNPTETRISKELIEKSYNPVLDSLNLRNNPEKFEELRNRYNYRHEPFFYRLS